MAYVKIFVFFSHPNSNVSKTIALGLLLNCQSRNLGNDLLPENKVYDSLLLTEAGG